MLNMGSASSDLTARATIRDTALRLFAEHGPDAVGVRRIATEAGVSPALVLHHFGSKAGLRDALDAHVIALIDALMPAPTDATVLDAATGGDAGMPGFAQAFPADSPVLPYLRRMLLTDDGRAHALVRRWHALTVELLRAWTARGLIDAGPHPEIRAALLLSADLGVVLLRGALTEALGFDPLAPDGIERWGGEFYALFALMLTTDHAPPARGDPQ